MRTLILALGEVQNDIINHKIFQMVRPRNEHLVRCYDFCGERTDNTACETYESGNSYTYRRRMISPMLNEKSRFLAIKVLVCSPHPAERLSIPCCNFTTIVMKKDSSPKRHDEHGKGAATVVGLLLELDTIDANNLDPERNAV